MKIEQLENFISAATSETFFLPNGDPHRYHSSAASEILELEEEFGTLLFIREGNNTGVLTDAGKTLLREAVPLVRQYHMTLRKMDMYRIRADRPIVIGSLPLLKQYRLNRVFKRFRSDHEDTKMVIEETDGKTLLEGLKENYYDAIVIRKNMIHGLDVTTFRMAADEMAAILPENHPLAHENYIRLATLKNETFYLTNPYTSSYSMAWKLIKDNHISTENVLTASIDRILPEIAAGKGVGILPISNVLSSRQPGITAIPLDPRAGLEVVFAIRKDVEFSDQMKELIAIIENRSIAVPAL